MSVDLEQHPTDEIIALFWERWHDIRQELAKAIGEYRTHEFAPQLENVVRSMNPGLLFAIQRGLTARHALAFSAAIPEAEQAVRRILAAAPQADDEWEYTDLITGPGDESEVTWVVGDLEVRMSEARAALVVSEQDSTSLVVLLYHPMWLELAPDTVAEIAEGTVARVCRAALEERYEVHCELKVSEPDGAIGLTELSVQVDQLVQRGTRRE